MSDTTFSRWYREGSATLSQNSDIITGKNTYWLNANIKPGDLFTLDSSKFYEVENVDSNTQITLKTPYLGATVSNANYAIIRNFTATLPAETAAKVVNVLAKNERYVDEELKTIKGQSAYEVAVEQGFVGNESEWLDTLNAYGQAKKNGYVGTLANWLESLTAYGIAKENGFSGSKADWLESLIGAGEWVKLAKRTIVTDPTDVALRLGNAAQEDFRPGGTDYEKAKKAYGVDSQDWLHNSIARGKCLGSSFTEEQLQSIYNGTFDDMYLGDYWAIPLSDIPAIANSGKFNTSKLRKRLIFTIIEFNRHKIQRKVCIMQPAYAKAFNKTTKSQYESWRETFNTSAVPHDFEGKVHVPYEEVITSQYNNHIMVMATIDFCFDDFYSSEDNSYTLFTANEDFVNTGYALSNLRKNIESSFMVANAIKPFFGENNFLTWCELLFSRFDTSTAKQTTPFLAHCKFELPTFYELYGEIRGHDDIFFKGTGYQKSGGMGEILGYEDLRKHALFNIISPTNIFYNLVSRDLYSSTQTLGISNFGCQLHALIKGNAINPIFCIGYDYAKEM